MPRLSDRLKSVKKLRGSRMSKAIPFSAEAEQGVLACCLLDVNGVSEAISCGITAHHFHDVRHQACFGAMLAMQEAGKPVDSLTLYEHLQDKGEIQQAGGAAYVSELSDKTGSATQLGYWAAKVREKKYARDVMLGANELIKAAQEDSGSLDEVAAKVETMIFNLRAQQSQRKGTRHESFVRIIASLEEAHRIKGQIIGIKTGFQDLDKAVLGLVPSELIVIAARPSFGKSALALNIAENIAEIGRPVGIFSFEMPEDAMNMRSLASRSGINMRKARQGALTDEELDRVINSIGPLSKLPIHICDNVNLKLNQVRAEARRMVSQHGVQAILVDYLQLVEAEGKNRLEEVSNISRGLKKMAMELNVPVVALSQLNREIEKMAREPRLSDLRESGTIEQDANVVMFIHCPDETKEENGRLPVQILIAKGRDIGRHKVDMIFNKWLTRFENIAKVEPQDANWKKN